MRRVVLLALLLLACGRGAVTRAEWQRMSATDRTLYVRSLLGAETVKERKGGRGHVFDRPAEEYVARIDAAYARGDRRTAEEIFAAMATR